MGGGQSVYHLMPCLCPEREVAGQATECLEQHGSSGINTPSFKEGGSDLTHPHASLIGMERKDRKSGDRRGSLEMSGDGNTYQPSRPKVDEGEGGLERRRLITRVLASS